MPFIVRKNPNKHTYKVTNAKTGKVYAYSTKIPKKVIQVVKLKERSAIARNTLMSISKSRNKSTSRSRK